MKCHRIVLMLFLSLLTTLVFTQEDGLPVKEDTLRTKGDSSLFIWQEHPDFPGLAKKEPILLPPAHPQHYHPASLHSSAEALAGNIGGPSRNLLHTGQAYNPIRLMPEAMGAYAAVLDPAFYYQTGLPYTLLRFNTGPGKEQNLGLTHAQQVETHWFVNLDYRVLSSPGSYQNQRNDHNDLNFSLRYQTLDKRYTAQAGFRHYKYRLQENGGIADDTLFLSGEESDPGIIPVFLSQANSIRRNSTFYLLQSYQLQPGSPDSLGRFSLFPNTLHHRFSYAADFRLFQDNDPLNAFYPAVFQDSSTTSDSIGLRVASHSLSLSNRPSSTPGALYYVSGLKHRRANYYDGLASRDHTLWEWFAYGQLPMRGSDHLSLSYQKTIGEETSLAAGFLRAAYYFRPGQDSLLHATLGAQRLSQAQALVFQHYAGNHYQWEGNPEPFQEFSVDMSAGLQDWTLALQYRREKDQMYVSSGGSPIQYGDALSIWRARLEKVFGAKGFTSQHSVSYQSVNKPFLQAVPEWIIQSGFQGEVKPFGASFRVRAALDLTYLSRFNGLYYDPVTGWYRVQFLSEQGGHLFTNASVSLLIRRASVFFQYRGIGEAIRGNGFYLSPSYPVVSQGLNFGVQWVFFD
jgi:hypothetical protein